MGRGDGARWTISDRQDSRSLRRLWGRRDSLWRRGHRAPAQPGSGLGGAVLRIVGVLLVALTSSVLLIAPAAAVAGVSVPAWSLDQGEAAVRAGDIASLPGATAVLDEAAVRAAIGRAPIRVALVPFVPVDSNRELMEQRALDLQTWSEQQGWPLIVVQGLQVLVSAYQISPGAVADLEPVLAHDDVTHQVLRAIVVLQKEATGTAGAAVTTPGGSATPAGSLTTTDAGSADGPAALPAQSTADPGEVERIGDALAADRIYNDPALSAQTVDQRWANVGPGLVVRAAFLPPAAPGRTLPDLITPLSKRFPGDVVVVMRGRWMEVAGPEQEMLDSATLWLYGNYMKPFLRWDVQPTQFVALLAGQIGLLRTGVVSDQSSPVTPNDPVNSARSWLPWLFAATALVLAGAAGWWAGRSRRNSRIAAEAAQRQGILRRRRIGARLAGVAGGIIELDALAQNRTAQDERDAAVERYRVARDLLTDDGDLEIAGDALEAAERHLVSAGRALGTRTASRAPRRGSPDGPS